MAMIVMVMMMMVIMKSQADHPHHDEGFAVIP